MKRRRKKSDLEARCYKTAGMHDFVVSNPHLILLFFAVERWHACPSKSDDAPVFLFLILHPYMI